MFINCRCRLHQTTHSHRSLEHSHITAHERISSFRTTKFICLFFINRKMASHQSNYDATKDTLGQKTEDTKNFGAEKTGQAQEHASKVGDATKQKAGEAKDSTDSAGQTAKDKAAQAKDNAGNMMQQAGDKVKEGWENTKNAVSGNK